MHRIFIGFPVALFCVTLSLPSDAQECFNTCFSASQARNSKGQMQIVVENKCGRDLTFVVAVKDGSSIRQIGWTGFKAYAGTNRRDCPYSTSTGMCPEVLVGMMTREDYSSFRGGYASAYDQKCGLVSAGPPTPYER